MAVISDVSRALRTLLRPALPPTAAIHLGPAAGSPTAAPSDATTASPAGSAADTPAVHLVLRWLREDPNGRQSGDRDVRADNGTLLGRQAPARRYELRYLVTARAGSAEAEYELLDAVLLAVTGLDALPADCLPKTMVDTGLPVYLQVCPESMPATAGLPAHAGFELTVSAPLLPPLQTELAPPAAELTVGVRRTVPPVPPSPLLPQPAAGSGRQWRRARVAEDLAESATDAGHATVDRAPAPRKAPAE